MAKEEFDAALKLSGDQFLMTKVSYAQYYLKAKYDQENFKKILQEVVDADLDKYPEVRLLNQLAQDQARELIKNADAIFYGDFF